MLNPNNLLFLSRQISQRENYLQFMPKALFYKLLFDLHFGFAAIFSSSEDIKVCQLLLKGCIWCLDFLIQTEKNDPDLERDPTIKHQIENLFYGKLIKGIIDLKQEKKDEDRTGSGKWKLIIEVIFRLNKLNDKYGSKTASSNKLNLREKPHVMELINCYENIEHGRNFINVVAGIKMRNILYMYQRKFAALDVQTKFGEAFFTNKKMYKTHFLSEIKKDADIRISVDCLTSLDSVKISSSSNVNAA